MELHFPKNASKFQCYYLWGKSHDYHGVYAFEACIRYALGNRLYFCDGKVKVVQKGTWGWVRDGWLTKTTFSSSDFMFHGWKKQKLNGEWVWPFTAQYFDHQSCDPGAPFVNFRHNSNFLKSDTEITSMLQKRKEDVHNEYIEILKRLGKL